MAYFEFPHTRDYEGDLGYIIKRLEELTIAYNNFFDLNKITFHDPIEWDIEESYKANTIIYDVQSATLYISRQAVPAGIDISNSDYWVVVSPFKIETELKADSINPVANRTLYAKFEAVIASIASNRAAVDLAIRNETTARENADTALQTSINQEASTRAAADTSLSDRIDAIISPATTDNEVIDIRTDVEGVTYSTAGTAVRALEKKVNAIQNYVFIASSYVNENGVIVTNAGARCRTDFLPMGAGVSVTYAGETKHAGVSGISFWDKDKNFILGYQNNEDNGTPVTVTSPDNTAFAIVCLNNTLKPKFVFSPVEGGLLSVANHLYSKISGDLAYLPIVTNGTNRSVAYTSLSGIDCVYINNSNYEMTLYYNTNEHTTWAKVINIADYANPNYIQIRKTDNSSMPAGSAREVVQAVSKKSLVHFDTPISCYGYVDGTNGSDTNSGMGRANALKTISKAVNMGFKNIIVAPDTYSESVAVRDIDELNIIADIGNTFSYPDSVDNPLVIIDATGSNEGFDIRNAKKVHFQNVKVINAGRYGYFLNNIEYLRFDYCFADTCASDGFKLQDVNGDFYNCEAHNIGTMGGGQHNDGFNMHGTGTTNFYNCSASYCEDDGISHHDACCGLIDGGEWHHCGKGGVASPTHGAVVDVKNIYSHDNEYGIYCDSTYEFTRRTINFTNCACKDNTSTDMYITSDYTANVWNCIYDTISSGGHINIIS